MGDSLRACAKRGVPSLAVAVVLLAAPAIAQIVPEGGEIAISRPDGDFESGVNVAADRNGGWGATWKTVHLDFLSETGRQRRFDRDGNPVAGSLRDHELVVADLGLDGAGNGVLAGVRPRPELGGAEVDAQCLDSLGAPLGARVRVDTGTISAASRYPGGVRVATDSDGASVVVWYEIPRLPGALPSLFFRRLRADCSTEGDVGSLGDIGVVGRRDPHVALRKGGGFVLVWIEGEVAANMHVRGQLFDSDGSEAASSFVVAPSGPWPAHPTAAVGPTGAFAVAWKSDSAPPTSGSGTGISARVFAADGTPAGPELNLRTSRAANTAETEVAAIGDGFIAVWGENGFVEEGSAVYGRAFGASAPIGAEVVLNAAHTDPGNVGVAALGGNEFVVVWDDLAEQTLPQDVVARRFLLVPPGTGCAESSATLCLGAERFRIAVDWRDYQGHRGSGHAYPLTTDSGLFWFFSETNLEVLVKVVNACAGFGRHWVYAAATTDVEYTLTATDTATGRSRSYFNPLGRRSPAITDSDAFASCP